MHVFVLLIPAVLDLQATNGIPYTIHWGNSEDIVAFLFLKVLTSRMPMETNYHSNSEKHTLRFMKI